MSGCTITDDWDYKGMRVVFLENACLRIGVLVGRGSDIFEFRYKPIDVDPLLRLPKGIINPGKDFSQIRNTNNQFEDYYYGGWQEILPNSTAFNYRGAVLGQHGEVSLIPWKYAIINNTAEEVALKVWTKPLRMPLLIEKTFILRRDESELLIEEQLTNQGNTNLDISWGHHIAFGLPFLEEGAEIETNAKTFLADPLMPVNRRFNPGVEYKWPFGKNVQGEDDNASTIPDANANPYSDLCYLKGYPDSAFYTITSKKYGIQFRLKWDGQLFKYTWLWQERFSTKDFPWWGQCYTVALEPWTSAGNPRPDEVHYKQDLLAIKAGETIKTNLSAGIHKRL